MSHTPGPWVAERGSHYWEVRPVNRANMNDPFQIGDVCSSAPDYPDDGVQEANARLFASAPDLLEALKDVKEWIASWDPNFIYDADWEESARRIDYAIAKAEGREP